MHNITSDSILAQLDKSSVLNIGIVASPEPIESSLNGVTRGRALYDTPPPGSQPEGLVRSSRSRVRTKRAKAGFDTDTAASKQRSSRSKRTRARNLGNSYSNHRQDRTARSQHAPQSDAESIAPGSAAAESEFDDGGRAPSKSPTPIYTAGEPEGQPCCDELQAKITQKFQRIIDNSGTQMLIDVDGAISVDPAYATQPQEYSSEARFLPPIEVGVGGGFHLDHPTHCPSNNKTYRGSKGQRYSPLPNHSEIELSSDHEASGIDVDPGIIPLHLPEQLVPRPRSQPTHDLESPFYTRKQNPFLGYPTDQSLQHPRHKRDGPNCNPAPQAHSTPGSPLPEGIPTSSQSLGDPIPMPAPSQVHAFDQVPTDNSQLRVKRSVARVSRSSKALSDSIPTRSAPGQCNTHEEQQSQGSQRSDLASSQQLRSQPRPRSPSALPPPPSASVAPARKRAATSTRLGRVRTYGTRLNIVEIHSQRLPTIKHSQKSARRQAVATTRRSTNPAPIQHAQSSSQHLSSREARHPLSQETGNDELDLLEGLDQDEYAAELKPTFCKPTSRDLHGIECALWILVWDVTWGFSIGQGNFQTRTVYNSWVDSVYSQVLAEKYPHLSFRPMSSNMSVVILNSLSNCRYQDLVRLRDPVKDYFGLKNPSTEQEHQENEKKVEGLYPNTFHHADLENIVDPYQGGIMPRALTNTFFYGTTAIGAMYPGLFEKTNNPKDERKHVAILAYLATMVQFCLAEWWTGYFKKGTLNANYLLSVYICHYDGLKAVTLRAPDRLTSLYKEWFKAALASSQAPIIFKRKPYIQPVTRPEDVRPDTPRHSPTPDGATQTVPTTPGPSRLPAGVLSTAPASPGPSCPPARALSTDRASRRYSPLAWCPGSAVVSPLRRSGVHRPTPHDSPLHMPPTPNTPYIIPFGSPFLDELPLHLSQPQPHNSTPTPERSIEGRFTSKAKAKGRAGD